MGLEPPPEKKENREREDVPGIVLGTAELEGDFAGVVVVVVLGESVLEGDFAGVVLEMAGVDGDFAGVVLGVAEVEGDFAGVVDEVGAAGFLEGEGFRPGVLMAGVAAGLLGNGCNLMISIER